MLNKLLKRCMPWMDKGRWYHISVTCDTTNDALSITDLRYDNRMFSGHEFESGTLSIQFSDPSINATIIDYKAIAHLTFPGQTSYVAYDVPFNVNSYESGFCIDLYPAPGSIDYWFFIKTN